MGVGEFLVPATIVLTTGDVGLDGFQLFAANFLSGAGVFIGRYSSVICVGAKIGGAQDVDGQTS